MASNDFLPFANGGSANVLTQAAYAALTSLLQNGFSSGVAQSNQLNKVWRQSSIMAAVLAQFAADYSGSNSTDDGTTATLEANLVAAIRSATKTTVTLTDTGTANAYAAANTPPLVAGTWVNNVVQQVKILNANTGASTYAPDGLTAIPIYGLGLQPLQGGELYAGGTAILMKQTITGINSGNPIAVLMECAGGAQQVSPATQSQHAAQLGQVASVVGTARGIKAQLTAAGTSMTMTGVEVVAKTALGGLSYVNANWSDTINIATTGAGGMDTGTAPVSGYVAIYRIYNPTTTTWKLLGYNATSAVAPEVYGGANMPVGYTASALVSVWPTNASSQFITGTQRDRTVTRAIITVLSTGTTQASPTSLSISGGVPPNASSLIGSCGAVPNSGQAAGAAAVSLLIYPDAAGTGSQGLGAVAGGGSGANANVSIPIYTSQTLYYTNSVSTGTANFTLGVVGYTF